MKTLKITLVSLLLISSGLVYSQNGVLRYQAPQTPQIPTITEKDYQAYADEGWLIDVNKAYEISKETGKPILANFTGSKWCGWCKKIKAEVFVKPTFKEWAKKNVVLLYLDYPRRYKLPKKYMEQNAGLQQAFQVSGYPTFWVFNLGKNEQGQFNIDALGKTGYMQGVSAFTGSIDSMIKQYNEKK